ncbi:piggyBac transposable element-derived protein 2-like [Bacillus rossius redtenbacheri]|uniref:piggyBac transposable element-derived protein 2-like n=1 Tax=Bacillus rossius redtenbacheri TaxID=93214 RepID=UPI002FDCE21B
MSRVPGKMKKVAVPPDSSEDDNFDDSDDDRDWIPNHTSASECSTGSDVSSNDDNGDTSEEELPLPSCSSGKSPKPKQHWWDVPNNLSEKPHPVWTGNVGEPNLLQFPVDYFRSLFNEQIIDNIVQESNLYSVQKNPNKPLNTNRKEIEQFMGICIYMSIYGLPRSRMYWSSNTRVEKVADIMSRGRWEELKANLHFNDNSKLPAGNDGNKDKLFKIRPLYEALCCNFKKLPMDEQMLCVDEQIVPFKGQSSLKQYNPKKPSKWGYKIFVLADSKGLIRNMEIYSGQTEAVTNLPNLGASSNVVLRLAQIVPQNQNYLLYFDNWFSSPGLLVTLGKLGIGSLSTVRLNRYSGLSFSSDKEMKKKGRGCIEEKETNIDGIDIRAVKWCDNRCVVVCSTFESAYPVSNVKRYDSKQKTSIEVSCPRAVTTYNKFMGVVDLMDALIARDCDSQNLCKNDRLDLLYFRTSVAELLCKHGIDMKKRGRPSSSQAALDHEYMLKKKKKSAAVLPSFVLKRDGLLTVDADPDILK